MMKNIGKVSNPLTIIAIFAGLAEINGTVVVSMISPDSQGVFLWFIILFPTLLVVLFFITLNFNPKVIYAPSDFSNEDNFLKTLNLNTQSFEPNNINIVANGKFTEEKGILTTKPWSNYSNNPFHPEARIYLETANNFYNFLNVLLREKMSVKTFKVFTYGIVAPEYFLVNYVFNKSFLQVSEESEIPRAIIIKVTGDPDDVKLIAIGKNIIKSSEKEFAEKIFEYIQTEIDSIKKHDKHNKSLNADSGNRPAAG